MKIRKTSQFLIEIILSIILIIFAFWKFQFSEEPHKIGIEIVGSIVAIFGLLIKTILAYLFPEIILDEKGIKILGRNKIFWKEIRAINLKSEDDNSQTIIIEKLNSKKVSENFQKLNISNHDLEFALNSYFEKYGIIKHRQN